MKRLLTFRLPQVVFESKPLEYKESGGSYEITAMLFSTAFNRNKAYFQVSDLMKWVNKTESILNDLDHDLSITGGRYFGTKDTKLVKIWDQFTDGDLEIWGTLQTKDPLFVANIDKITAPSIELMVDEENCICNEYGEYYTQIDWVGIGWLRGMVAGSGNARVTEIKEFNHLSIFNIQNDMNKEEIQALLDAQKEDLKAEFKAQTEASLKSFGEIVRSSQSATVAEYEYTDDEGNKYKTTEKNMWQSITELVEKGTVSGDLLELMKAKKLEVKAFSDESGDGTTPPPADPEPTPEQLEDQEILAQVQASLKTAEKREEILKKFRDSKQVDNRETDVSNVVKPASYNEFISSLVS